MATSSLWAMDLTEARAKGLVTETDNGYIKGLSPAVTELVIEVNIGREKFYSDLSAKNGTTIEAVAALAAKKLKEKHNK